MRLRLSPWPVERPGNWTRVVNGGLGEEELGLLQTSVRRGRPFGDAKWTAATVAKLGLESTVRDPWRPRKKMAGDAAETRAGAVKRG